MSSHKWMENVHPGERSTLIDLKMTEVPVVETSVTINNNESNLWTTLTQTILLHLLTN